MNIHEICSDSKASYKHITMTLDYDEVLCLLNLLNKYSDQYKDRIFCKLHRNFFVAFQLMKHGILDSFGCNHAAELQKIIDETSEKELQKWSAQSETTLLV